MAVVKSAREIRESFLAFFEERAHRRVTSTSLLPDSDPTLMFVNAGMVPFKRIFLGEESRGYLRATSAQKCMRVSGKHNDLENVGRTPRHHTFFEMLGNFSFGDYFKEEAINFAWEFLTERLEIPEANLVVSVFREDDEAFDIWKNLVGIPTNRIYRLDEDENFWSMGDTGPCGPCSEIHYDTTPEVSPLEDDPSSDTGRFLEIWNLVFMQFNRSSDGGLAPLPKPCVDTGAGLERLAAVLQGVPSNYDTDLFSGILKKASECTGVELGLADESDISLRVIADHARAVSFLVGDGVLPSNEGRGYVLRRILRRAARHGVLLGKEEPFLYEVTSAVVEEMGSAYPELRERGDYISARVQREEERFLETLAKGLSLLEQEIARAKSRGALKLSGETVFKLYDTYGFPSDLTEDILSDHDLIIDKPGFAREMESQRSRSRASWRGSGDSEIGEIYSRIASDLNCSFSGYENLQDSAETLVLISRGNLVDVAPVGEEIELVVRSTPFYAESGGQVGDRGIGESLSSSFEVLDTYKPAEGLIAHRCRVVRGELGTGVEVTLSVDRESRKATTRNHSGTHLLHSALRENLGSQVMQKGSLVSPERLRFDFTSDGPLTTEQIETIEDRVNFWIEENHETIIENMSHREAVDAGAIALFEEKYGDEVRVVSFGEASTELCGGTHVEATGNIGLFKIISEAGIASGIRRIEALTGVGAFNYMRSQEHQLRELESLLKVGQKDISRRVTRILDEHREMERNISELHRELNKLSSDDLMSKVETVNAIALLMATVEVSGKNDLREMVDNFRNRLKRGVVLLVSQNEEGVNLALGVTAELTEHLSAGVLIREVAQVLGGKGGGRADFAQAGAPNVLKLPDAFSKLRKLISNS